MKSRIRKVRKMADLTQEAFAGRIGIKRITLAQYEGGRNEPIDAVISLICREFGVNEEWLRYGTGEMYSTPSDDEYLMQWAGEVLSEETPSFRKRLIEALSKLDEDDWQALERIALKLTGKPPGEELDEDPDANGEEESEENEKADE